MPDPPAYHKFAVAPRPPPGAAHGGRIGLGARGRAVGCRWRCCALVGWSLLTAVSIPPPGMRFQVMLRRAREARRFRRARKSDFGDCSDCLTDTAYTYSCSIQGLTDSCTGVGRVYFLPYTGYYTALRTPAVLVSTRQLDSATPSRTHSYRSSCLQR